MGHTPRTGGDELPAGEGTLERIALEYVATMESPDTRRTVLSGLKTLAGIMGPIPLWPQCERSDAIWLRDYLREQYSLGYANKLLSYWRGLLREYHRQGILDARRLDQLTHRTQVKGAAGRPGRCLSRDEQARLFRHCVDGTDRGIRDRAIFAVMLGAGLRCNEVAMLTRESVYVAAPPCLYVTGKGNKVRVIDLSAPVAEALKAWLFLAGPWTPERLVFGVGARDVRRIVERRRRRAKVAPFSTHDCRRTFISRLLDSGVDLACVQRLAGHADPRTTVQYDRRSRDTARAAVGTLELPIFSNNQADPA